MTVLAIKPFKIDTLFLPDGSSIPAGTKKTRLLLPGLTEYPEAGVACSREISCAMNLFRTWAPVNIAGVDVFINKQSVLKRLGIPFSLFLKFLDEGKLGSHLEKVKQRYDQARMLIKTITACDCPPKQLLAIIRRAHAILSSHTHSTNAYALLEDGYLAGQNATQYRILRKSHTFTIIRKKRCEISAFEGLAERTTVILKKAPFSLTVEAHRSHKELQQEHSILSAIHNDLKKKSLPFTGLPKHKCEYITVTTGPLQVFPALLMRYCRGGDLKKHIVSGCLHKRGTAKRWTKQLIQGLHTLHTVVRVVHRDIKPANIFVNNDGDVQFGDFGFSHKVDNISLSFRTKGTPGYVCGILVLNKKAVYRKLTDDEIAQKLHYQEKKEDSQRVIKSIDIYGLAITIIEMLLGISHGSFVSFFFEKVIEEGTEEELLQIIKILDKGITESTITEIRTILRVPSEESIMKQSFQEDVKRLQEKFLMNDDDIIKGMKLILKGKSEGQIICSLYKTKLKKFFCFSNEQMRCLYKMLSKDPLLRPTIEKVAEVFEVDVSSCELHEEMR
jgi:serine/threonine protein kinase